MPDGDYKLICKGPELTEDIAKGLVHSMNFGTDENPDIGYHHSIKDNYWGSTALESFISVIESKGYHWGDNPVKFNDDEVDFEKRHKNRIEWEQAESRTFNPEKSIIFEIV